MKTFTPHKADPKLDLVLERVVDVPPELVWEAWTTPEHVKQWFTPAPWKTVDCRIDLRPGGEFYSLMESPDGQQFPNHGCILYLDPGRMLVTTECLLPGFRPAPEPFMTAIIEMIPEGKGTRYRAIAMHTSEEKRKKHEEMGFQDGWGKALDQLVELMRKKMK